MISKNSYILLILVCVLKEGTSRLLPATTSEIESLNYVFPFFRNSLRDCPMYYYKYGKTGVIAPFGGVPAFFREFAHMAAIGWSQADGRIEWDCGGSLITEDIILTAAHCTSRENVKPDVARMGDLDLFSNKDDKYAQQIKIIEIIRHEKYKFSTNYFDIAILRLENPIKVHDTVCPACLWNDANVEFPRLEATGWGDTGFSEKRTPILLKVSLTPHSNQECNTYYPKSRNLKDGIIDSQICAGDENMDTCPGDSGGPLQIKLLAKLRLIPFIVGVTSFGPACGFATPAVYTRVSSYIDWIEAKTNTSFKPIDCTLRYTDFRDYEPDVILSKTEKLESLDLTKGHVDTSSNFNNKVSLGYLDWNQKFTRLSSGVLISDNYVLTTASGINSNKISPGLVELGSGNIIEIDKIIVHPQLDPSTNGNDIALIRLKKDIEIDMDTQLPSCLWEYPKIPAIGQYDGIGRGPWTISDNAFDGNDSSEDNTTQLTLKLDIIENGECANAYYSKRKLVPFKNESFVLTNGISDTQLCAGYTRFFIVPGICELDYGNTLQHELYFNSKYFIFDFGLNSFGHQCGFGVPAVFTRISSYTDWIDSQIFENTENVSISIQNDYFKSESDRCTSSYLEEKIQYNSSDYQDSFEGRFEEFHEFYDEERSLKVGEFPHTAVITWNDTEEDRPCIGALLSLNFVLTTASCLSSKKGSPESVILGVNSVEEDCAFEQKFKIADIIFHPEFLAQNVIDLALVKLDGMVKVNTFVMLACLWANTTHTPFRLFSTGVSATNQDLIGQVRIAKYNADCKRKYYTNLKDDELCADAFSTDANTCQEKTGDILQAIWFENDVVHHYIVGFFARVDKCETYPSVYIRITPYIDWINSIIT